MTDDQILEVVRAHKEGKKIERRVFSESGFTYEQWVPDPSPSWDFGDTVYRVAPEPRKPREWMINVLPDGRINTGALSASHITQDDHCSLVRVREVIE